MRSRLLLLCSSSQTLNEYIKRNRVRPELYKSQILRPYKYLGNRTPADLPHSEEEGSSGWRTNLTWPYMCLHDTTGPYMVNGQWLYTYTILESNRFIFRGVHASL